MTYFLARLKYYLDQGASFTAFINLALLSITTSATIAPIVGVRGRWIALAMFPVVVITTGLIGYGLDKIGFPRAYTEEQNKRNDMLREAIKGRIKKGNFYVP